MSRRALGLLLPLLLGGLACAESGEAGGPVPRLWTLFDVAALRAGGLDASHGLAADAEIPGGVLLKHVFDFESAETNRPFERWTLTSEYAGKYLTTEVWADFDEVWVQPMYVPVIGWDPAGRPMPLAPRDAWIFSVGPESAFYSPYWEIVYVEVPPDTDPAALRSVEDVRKSGYPLVRRGEGRTVSLVPDDVSEAETGYAAGVGWIEGRRVKVLDFGRGLFKWNVAGVVNEVPIYILLFPGADGRLHALDVPTVAAPYPPGNNQDPPILGGQSRYAAYWRLHTAVVPPALRIFAPQSHTPPALYDAIVASGFPMLDESMYPAFLAGVTPEQLAPYLGRVMRDQTCFASASDLSTLDEECRWIRSQADIETYFDPSVVRRTRISVTCPFVEMNSQRAVPF